ncbi:VOC family protein [Micrococcus sp.]|uniref:VOC family protein n=1 Tax=Micrococcus sp. TaxID=1271 RepID=UPI0026DBBFF4|nr:VOC family protein [Micrococcus sp.]MDO4239021.1 VOC family protein [Micrococcus sp.]
MVTGPVLQQVVLDATDIRPLAEFYRRLLDLRYRKGDQPPADGTPDDGDWLVLLDHEGRRVLAFQQTDELTPTTWPSPEIPMQAHLDLTVPDVESLRAAHTLALGLGARLLRDESEDPEERLYVYADPAGHPFCIFVA